MAPHKWMFLVIGLAAPVVHAQTEPAYSQDYGQDDGYDNADYSQGTEPVAPYAPPALPNETRTSRPYGDAVWVSGHWYWDGNDWRFNAGTWIASMPGYQFVNGYWQQQAGGWGWISGGWARPGSTQVEIPIEATNEEVMANQAPPEPQYEAPPPAPAPSYTWAPGYWYWSGLNWSWVSGSWMAPPRAGLVFVTPRWVQRGPSWYFVGGGWAVNGSRRVVVPEYRYADVSVRWGRPSYFVHSWRRYPSFQWSRPYNSYRSSGPRYSAPPSRGWDNGSRYHEARPNGPGRYDRPRYESPRESSPRYDAPRHDSSPRGGGWGRSNATQVHDSGGGSHGASPVHGGGGHHR